MSSKSKIEWTDATRWERRLKPYEFQRWPAPKSLIGKRIAIHAAARACDLEDVRAIARDPGRTCFGGDAEAARNFALSILSGEAAVPRGLVLGAMTLGEPRRALDLALASCDPASTDPDIWAWPVLAPQLLFQPIPAGGRQGFWRWHQSELFMP